MITSLRYQDRLDEASNFAIWKAKMLFLLDEHGPEGVCDNSCRCIDRPYLVPRV